MRLEPHADTGLLVARAPSIFRAPRGERTVFAGGRRVTVHTSGERVLHLPNGDKVKVTVDDSGCATQIDDGDHLHAIARPAPIRLRIPPPGG